MVGRPSGPNANSIWRVSKETQEPQGNSFSVRIANTGRVAEWAKCEQYLAGFKRNPGTTRQQFFSSHSEHWKSGRVVEGAALEKP